MLTSDDLKVICWAVLMCVDDGWLRVLSFEPNQIAVEITDEGRQVLEVVCHPKKRVG